MTEFQTNPEAVTPPHKVEVISSLLTDEALSARRQQLEGVLAGDDDPYVADVAKLMDASDRYGEEAIQAWYDHDIALHDKYKRHAERARETAYSTFGRETVNKYYQTKEALRELDRTEYEGMQFFGEESTHLFEELMAGNPVIDDGIDREHVVPPALRDGATTEDYITYLGSKLYIDRNFMYISSQRSLKLMPVENKPFVVPVANIVTSHGGFDSWTGRGHKGVANKMYQKSTGEQGTFSSISAIKDYAERDTPLPPLEEIYAYVQPDGTVIFATGTSNHRTAAAIVRGQDHVMVDGMVTVRLLDRNVIQPTPGRTA